MTRTPGTVHVQAAEYCELMSRFPTGVAVVTAVDPAGRLHGMTCTSLASVAVCPPTLLVCLNSNSGTLAAVRERRLFGVNMLGVHARTTAELFASATRDRFAQRAWRPSATLGVPWLTEDAAAFAECRVTGTTVVGDHEVVFGEVVHTVLFARDPLLYGLRRFSAW
jgi:flavin reductase (DIM6/NTAB) family NADH-FMN oxidoreductase RutF